MGQYLKRNQLESSTKAEPIAAIAPRRAINVAIIAINRTRRRSIVSSSRSTLLITPFTKRAGVRMQFDDPGSFRLCAQAELSPQNSGRRDFANKLRTFDHAVSKLF
jgi:hypothetical protein